MAKSTPKEPGGTNERSDALIVYGLEHPALLTTIGLTLLITVKVLIVARLQPTVALGLVTSADPARFLAGMFVSLGPSLISSGAVLSWIRWAGTTGRVAMIYLTIGVVLTALTVATASLLGAGALLVIALTIWFGRSRGRDYSSPPIGYVAVLGIAVIVLNYLIRGPLWLPSEVMTFDSTNAAGNVEGVTRTYYVVEEDGPWLTALDERDRSLIRLPLSEIRERQLCQVGPGAGQLTLFELISAPVQIATCK